MTTRITRRALLGAMLAGAGALALARGGAAAPPGRDAWRRAVDAHLADIDRRLLALGAA